MIFIANALVMNGGTTFLIRVCRELNKQGTRCTVIVCRRQYDEKLLAELESHARILWLDQYLYDHAKVFRGHLGTLGPIAWTHLRRALGGNDAPLIHSMGIFGFLFGLRLASYFSAARVTVGIYHQNEFLFEAPPLYFTSESKRLFSELAPQNVMYFNEATCRSYSRYFDKDYSSAPMVPIGVDLSQLHARYDGREPCRIVSVGLLEAFKAYNAHMIRVVARLLDKYPCIQYEIYGEGPEEAALRALAKSLNVQDRVHFHGKLPYADFAKIVETCDVFVGSGTALIEAAALGTPALIGIESVALPETYGFLSDVPGLSYNEDNLNLPKVGIENLVQQLFSDPSYRAAIGRACRDKAKIFSVTETANGFMALDKKASLTFPKLSVPKLVSLFISLIALGLIEKFGFSSAFSHRRNQSH